MGNGNLTAKEDISIENLYNFIRASLVALQPTDGFGEADFTCPICGSQAHTSGEIRVKYIIMEIYRAGAGIPFISSLCHD